MARLYPSGPMGLQEALIVGSLIEQHLNIADVVFREGLDVYLCAQITLET